MSDGTTTVAMQDLLDRLAAGDEAAKEQLIVRALERLTIIARELLRGFGGEQRVEMWSTEIVNEAFPRISKAIEDVQPETVPKFLALARLQMHRLLLDKVRSLQRRSSLPGDPDGAGGRKAKKDTEREQMLVLDLLEAVERLPERQAETVWFKLAGYTHREIGEFLGVHHDTVDDYWNKAVVKLRKPLAPFMEGLKPSANTGS